MADKYHEGEFGGDLKAVLAYNSKVRQDTTICLKQSQKKKFPFPYLTCLTSDSERI